MIKVGLSKFFQLGKSKKTNALQIMSTHYFKPLIPDNFFHILNRGNNGCKLFYNPDNYEHFLRKYDGYLSAYLTTYAFCLLGNHFHLLVKLNRTSDIIETAIKNDVLDLRLSKFLKLGKSQGEVAGLILSNQFRKFFMSYAKAINNQEKRTGSLFEKNFHRILIDNITYLNNLIQYIHYNPIHHYFTDN